ncbi:hypothetical protein Afil01_41530 [Actinorhabdospora filicis]|uniref:Aminoglycoside phosphotransferase domain-containing protein n=1 Tax=Actinorhabdospora filicis TaxID=1785913 RepID=A0A9W6SRD5_9ACTN|nr:phosphotransferase [Actinorhabdospora filicis]GLZ79346.1 hypothetical protein Afil01_41530 [Actinorhabdospora filicis]
MSTVTGDSVPYDRTAQRPAFETLPEFVRDTIRAALGDEIISVALAGSGFTSGFAGVVTAANGRSLFVKAAGPDKPSVLGSYRREREINAALPAGLPAPGLEFATELGGWIVLGFATVVGRAPALPMSPADVTSMLDAWARAAELLAPVSDAFRSVGIRTLEEDAGDQFHGFAEMASGLSTPAPGVPVERLADLAAMEAGVFDAVRADAVTHGDLRPDNMIVTGSGSLICDWNWPTIAAPWFDTVFFLVTARGDGHDADSLFFAHPTAAGVTGDQLDAVLAAAAGYYLDRARRDPFPGSSPHLQPHRRWSGEAALAWLASRHGW